MDSKMLEPVIYKNCEATKSYNIYYLFMIAMLGGVIPVGILGVINMKWLKINEKWIYTYTTICISAFLAWVYLIYLYSNGDLDMNRAAVKSIIRLMGAMVYLVAYIIMKKEFRKHYIYINEFEPLLNDAIKYIIFSSVISTIVLAAIMSI